MNRRQLIGLLRMQYPALDATERCRRLMDATSFVVSVVDIFVGCAVKQQFVIAPGTVSLDTVVDYMQKTLEKTKHAEKDLQRYMHYYNKYKAHTDSLNAEVQMKERTQAKISKLKEHSVSQDFSWVTIGLHRLFRSRQVLSYSYPFAYYMFGSELFSSEMTNKEREIKQNLFEDRQQQLEANVEKLSMIFEEPFDAYAEDKFTETRTKIIALSKVADDLLQKIVRSH